MFSRNYPKNGGSSFSPSASSCLRPGKGRCTRLLLTFALIASLAMIVQADTAVSNAEIDYHDGERYPALERVEGTPAYLDDITKPLTIPEKAPAAAKQEGDSDQ